MDKPMSNGGRVRTLREGAGYSVDDLAVTCGLTVAEIEAIEAGDVADPAHLRRIAAALGLSEDALFES